MWRVEPNFFTDRKEEALALKAHFTPGDSIVLGKIGLLGYYSDLHIYDRSGLVDRRVAMRPRTRNPLRMPGHDSKVSTDFFFADEPTVVLHERLDGPPPSRKNTEYPLLRRVRMKAESWRKFSIWRRYVPEVLPLKPSPDGSPNVLMVLRLIEEEPRVATLPRPERVATRTKRAEKAWNDFFAGLDSALPVRHLVRVLRGGRHRRQSPWPRLSCGEHSCSLACGAATFRVSSNSSDGLSPRRTT